MLQVVTSVKEHALEDSSQGVDEIVQVLSLVFFAVDLHEIMQPGPSQHTSCSGRVATPCDLGIR